MIVDRVESHVRGAWSGRPGGTLRLAAAAYGLVTGLRNLMYDSGICAAHRLEAPVVSIGGLTVGGSGKTPIAADLASRLKGAGVPVAVLTHGFEDEMDVHRTISPESRVYGGRDRVRLGREAAALGARMLVLDSGFQYRRLYRDLDIVALDEEALRLSRRLLPAGPYRERLSALARADLLVVVRRSVEPAAPMAEDPGPAPERTAWLPVLDEVDGAPPVVSAHIRPGRLVAVNELAGEIRDPAPRVAVAGIMWPGTFFSQAGSVAPGLSETVSLPDHAKIDRSLRKRLAKTAAGYGIVCTLKDAGKLRDALGDRVPIWYLSEDVVWDGPEPTPAPLRMAMALLNAEDAHPTEGPT